MASLSVIRLQFIAHPRTFAILRGSRMASKNIQKHRISKLEQWRDTIDVDWLHSHFLLVKSERLQSYNSFLYFKWGEAGMARRGVFVIIADLASEVISHQTSMYKSITDKSGVFKFESSLSTDERTVWPLHHLNVSGNARLQCNTISSRHAVCNWSRPAIVHPGIYRWSTIACLLHLPFTNRPAAVLHRLTLYLSSFHHTPLYAAAMSSYQQDLC